MALDATGTPTTFATLPTYNTAVDIPSGKGFNATIQAIDAFLLAKYGPAALSWYNVKTNYGAIGNGITDDTVAIQNAINACITGGGGTVYLPAGDYKITARLTFANMNGTYKGVTFKGAASGGRDSGYDSATRILNYNVGSALYAQSTSTGFYITGLYLEDFAILNMVNIGAGNYTIYWNALPATCGIKRVNVFGNGTSATVGNGIAVVNPFNGQQTFEDLTVWNFNNAASTCYRFTAATEGGITALNSGNIVVSSCIAYNGGTGFSIGTSGSLFNGAVFNSLKAIGNDIGVSLTSVEQCVFNAPHVEGASNIGILLDNAKLNTVSSPLVSGAPTGIRIQNPSKGNYVLASYLANCTSGVILDAATAKNIVSASNRTGVTTLFTDAGTGNTTTDLT